MHAPCQRLRIAVRQDLSFAFAPGSLPLSLRKIMTRLPTADAVCRASPAFSPSPRLLPQFVLGLLALGLGTGPAASATPVVGGTVRMEALFTRPGPTGEEEDLSLETKIVELVNQAAPEDNELYDAFLEDWKAMRKHPLAEVAEELAAGPVRSTRANADATGAKQEAISGNGTVSCR